MKTAKEWFETLPEPAHTQAIFNTLDTDIVNECHSLPDAIETSFVWQYTREGYLYWKKLAHKYRKKYGRN